MRGIRCKQYTSEEIKDILQLWEEGSSVADIAEMTGRTVNSIYKFLSDERTTQKCSKRMNGDTPKAVVKSEQTMTPAVLVKQTENQARQKEMSPREMIKKLYDMGYRIENNHLVCYQKIVVKVNDILNES